MSIAVIGASAQPGKVGHDILKNLLEQGFGGKVYPINPKHESILGQQAFPSVKSVFADIDLAVIVTPAATVADLLKECAEKKIRSVVVISAGFKETGTDEGKAMEEEIRDIAKANNIQLLGVNCLGLLRPSLKLNASFAKSLPPEGHIALVSQSGALGVAIMDAAEPLHLGFSTILSIGNKTVLDECDFLQMCADDPDTHVIGLYLEDIKDGKRFMTLARDVSRMKPIVLLKAGTSARGRKAVSSHTGALAGSDSAIDALCRQTGIQRAHSAEEFLDALRVLSMQPPLLSHRIAVVTNAGGPGILATDAAEKEGLQLANLSKPQEDKLRRILPAAASVGNPVDVLGDAGTDRYEAALEACGLDPNIDGIALLLTPQVMTPCTDIARITRDVMKRFPLMPITVCFMGGQTVDEAVAFLGNEGIPAFDTPERAIRALKYLHLPEAVPTDERLTPPAVSQTRIRKADMLLRDAHGLLTETTTSDLCKMYDLPLPSQAVATSSVEASKIARSIGMPVIAKINSPDIIHKTDLGGIRANLRTVTEVRKAYTEIMKNVKKSNPDARLEGVLIQKFLPVGNEFIIGCVRDPSFGPLVMVGLGGIYTELFRDTSFRIAPVCEQEAYGMLQELKSWKLLLGMRGKSQSDIDALARLIVRVSHMVNECSSIKELDLNPVLVSEDGVIVADAKIITD